LVPPGAKEKAAPAHRRDQKAAALRGSSDIGFVR
jgi:hypothetical protein